MVEDAHHLARVCDYIPLNPVRAEVVTADRVGEQRSSRLWPCLPATPRDWFQSAERWPSLGLETQSDPWRPYLDPWANIAATRDDDRTVRGAYSGGWTIGTAGWRKASARQHSHLALSPEMSATEIAEIKCARWQQAADAAFREAGKSLAEAASAPKGVGWNVAIARTRRTTVAAPYRWIATPAKRGHPAAGRGDLSPRTLQSAD